MKRLGELDNIQRLYEIKENVMKSQKDMTKQFNDSVIGCLAGFAKTVWEKGIEGLEEETRHLPKSIPLFVDMILVLRPSQLDLQLT
ncbi:MAG: hypothetical protein MR383_10920 [Lachnospiraceae bacterium]|nr:hypothetical protein [Lachnospiraceae bacterium]